MENENKPWWFDKDFEYYFGAMFECGDYEKLLDKIKTIEAEAHRRGKVEGLEEAIDVYTKHLGIEEDFQYAWKGAAQELDSRIQQYDSPSQDQN